ncbi:MAG: HDIG domain-containing protein, partial [Eudoraea sp.]|nr:HDIG domain-containing protein [Eudoraea sp.]
MAASMDKIYRSQSLVYKYFLYFLTVGCIVFFFPKGGKFKYEFQKGKPWQYENLYAPFDFSIRKSNAEIEKERDSIRRNQISYYAYDKQAAEEIINGYEVAFTSVFTRNKYSSSQLNVYSTVGREILQELDATGIWPELRESDQGKSVYLVKDNEAVLVNSDEVVQLSDLDKLLGDKIRTKGLGRLTNEFKKVLLPLLKPNILFDAEFSARELENELSKVSLTLGNVDEGKLIVAKGEVVEADNLVILDSLKGEYESELWAASNYYFIIGGYTILVALVLMMLFLFIKKYRPEVFRNNVKVTFIFFNILLMVFITTFVVKYNDTYVFVVPLCILPLILKTFFDARLGLFVHVLTVLILGFVVPNSFEYIFLQIIAGIVTILTVSELYKRANLFISVGQITLIYIVGYFAFNVIHEGNLENIIWVTFGFFLLNGMITLFAQPLIYIYEKIFGMVSDVSLLELSDTNSRLLKELANKAPGTFHHSLQVANLAEAAANKVGANAMLVRVGALYHDIGKMNRPTFFTENQITNINPHDDLTPTDSARIIIDHVIEGIEIARKNKLPDRVIDFIRTHHGTNLVYYFYRKQQELQDEVDESLFRYPGPIPFSKETAILMMADSVEAASKSLK